MDVDWPKLISAQNISLDKLPADLLNGLLSGNGDIGISVFGGPECISVQVGKNDILDYRDGVDTKRGMTQKQFLEKYADPTKPALTNYFAGGDDPENEAIRQNYIHSSSTTKPAGRIRIRRSGPKKGDWAGRLDLWNSEISVGPKGTAPGKCRVFASYARNLIVVHYVPQGTESFDIELARHKDSTGKIDSAPEFGAAGRDIWFRYKWPGDRLNYPSGFEYVMHARVIGADKVEVATNPEFAKISQWVWEGGGPQAVEGVSVAHVTASRPVTILVAVVTTRDAPDPSTSARDTVDKAAARGLRRLVDEHRKPWHAFWQRSFVVIPAKPFINQQWFISQYLLACCWRPGKVAPGVFGPWAWEDHPAFGNDYCWDYNMQQAVWGAYSSNHLEQTIPYDDAALALLPVAKTDARETYGIDGSKFFLTSSPRKYEHDSFPLIHYDRMMSVSAWVAQPMWWHYQHTQNISYLRERAYPLMRECAKFYAAFLTLAPDGRYDIWPTAAWDVPLSPHLSANKNCSMDLGLIRGLLRSCAAAAAILGVDVEQRATWTNIADQIRGYPTVDTPDGKVYAMFEGVPCNYLFPVNTIPLFPGEHIGLHSPRPAREIALRTVNSIGFLANGESILKAMAKVRMGLDVIDAFEADTRKIRMPNGGMLIDCWRTNAWVHACGWPIVINESILQSYTNALHVAPVKMASGARFCGLRTFGAFLVSGEIRPGGDIAYIAVTSEAGRQCSVIRPWPSVVRVRDAATMKSVYVREIDGKLSFTTRKGRTYIIDRPGDPWEKQPTVRLPTE